MLRFQLLGYDFQKPHFLNGAIYKEVQYFRGSSFMHIFMSTEIKTILNRILFLSKRGMNNIKSDMLLMSAPPDAELESR